MYRKLVKFHNILIGASTQLITLVKPSQNNGTRSDDWVTQLPYAVSTIQCSYCMFFRSRKLQLIQCWHNQTSPNRTTQDQKFQFNSIQAVLKELDIIRSCFSSKKQQCSFKILTPIESTNRL